MKYIIHAMEKDHKNIERWALAELNGLDYVREYAYKICRELINDNKEVENTIQKIAAAKAKKNRNANLNEIKSQLYYDHSIFDVYQVDEKKYPTWQSMTKEYLKDRQKFATNFCTQVI